MELFKFIVDILTSLASIVAIVSVLISWYRDTRRPLTIRRVVVHRKKDETTFILLVKNVKDYPVTIKRTDCYKRKKFQVQKKQGGKLEYSEVFPSSERVFTSTEVFEIPPIGHTDIRIKMEDATNVPSQLLFCIESSHGYHELRCRDIVVVEIGTVDFYRLEYKKEYSSKWFAKIMYYLALIQSLTNR